MVWEIVQPILGTLSLLVGVVLAEYFVHKAYGRLKKPALYFLEIAIFVVFVSLVTNSLYMKSFDLKSILLTYLAVGFIGIIFSYTIISLFGMEKEARKERREEIREEDYIIRIAALLKRERMGAVKIKNILKKAKFKAKLVERIVDDILAEE